MRANETVINAHDIFNYDILMRLWVDGFIILSGNVSKISYIL